VLSLEPSVEWSGGMFRYLYSTILFSEEMTHIRLIYITADNLISEFRINFLLPPNKLYTKNTLKKKVLVKEYE